MTLRKISTSILFLLTAAAIFISCDADNNRIAVSGWKILYSVEESPEKARSSEGWQPASLLSLPQHPGASNRGYSYIWLRGEFRIEGNPGMYYGISTGRVSLTDTVYINGQLIGKTRWSTANLFPLPRDYHIQDGVLKTGANEIIIRIGTYGFEPVGIIGTVEILTEDSFELSSLMNRFIYTCMPIGVSILFINLFIILLLAYMINRNEKIIIYNALAVFSIFLLIITLYIPFRFISPDMVMKIHYSATPVFSVIFIMILQAIYRIYLTEYNRIIIPVITAFLLFIFLSDYTVMGMSLGRLLSLVIIIMIAPCLIFLTYRLNSLSPARFKFLVALCLSIMICLIISAEIISSLTGGEHSEYLTIYLSPVFIPVFTVLFAREFLRRKIELENIYSRLKKNIGREPSITGASEEKLKRVIEFINGNYRSDISREGLAAAVDMNPNYMGSQFKSYTGKRIGDYINELRVNEAALMLAEKNRRIIDIALSVGFESIITFNRSFKSITGTTPSEYRNNLQIPV